MMSKPAQITSNIQQDSFFFVTGSTFVWPPKHSKAALIYAQYTEPDTASSKTVCPLSQEELTGEHLRHKTMLWLKDDLTVIWHKLKAG